MRKQLMAGALAIAIVAAGASIAVAGDDDDDVVRVTATFVEEKEVDLDPAGFGVGDRFVFSQDLSRGGEKVGESAVECVFVRAGDQTSTANCVGSFTLPGGQIAAQGLVTFTQEDAPFSVAVTGGTGRYSEAEGELHVETVSETEERLTFRLD
jgi:hypothetical protein